MLVKPIISLLFCFLFSQFVMAARVSLSTLSRKDADIARCMKKYPTWCKDKKFFAEEVMWKDSGTGSTIKIHVFRTKGMDVDKVLTHTKSISGVLHDDEQPAFITAMRQAAKYGGTVVALECGESRNCKFKSRSKSFRNRIKKIKRKANKQGKESLNEREKNLLAVAHASRNKGRAVDPNRLFCHEGFYQEIMGHNEGEVAWTFHANRKKKTPTSYQIHGKCSRAAINAGEIVANYHTTTRGSLEVHYRHCGDPVGDFYVTNGFSKKPAGKTRAVIGCLLGKKVSVLYEINTPGASDCSMSYEYISHARKNGMEEYVVYLNGEVLGKYFSKKVVGRQVAMAEKARKCLIKAKVANKASEVEILPAVKGSN